MHFIRLVHQAATLEAGPAPDMPPNPVIARMQEQLDRFRTAVEDGDDPRVERDLVTLYERLLDTARRKLRP